MCEPHDSTGEPGAGNRHAGFGERGEETCPWDSDCGPVRKRRQSHRLPTGYAPPLDSTPNKTWIDVACFGEPGRNYPGTFSLMYIDIYLYNGSTLVYNSTTAGFDRGICDVSRGVDTSFIEIQRSLVFDSWTVLVTEAEKSSRGVQTGDTVYRRAGTLPTWCSGTTWQCEQATVRYKNPVHLYQ